MFAAKFGTADSPTCATAGSGQKMILANAEVASRMSRQFKNGKCSCWNDVDKQLDKAGANARLALSFSLNGHHYLQVKTENVNTSRKAPKTVIASYCPFCGTKLK